MSQRLYTEPPLCFRCCAVLLASSQISPCKGKGSISILLLRRLNITTEPRLRCPSRAALPRGCGLSFAQGSQRVLHSMPFTWTPSSHHRPQPYPQVLRILPSPPRHRLCPLWLGPLSFPCHLPTSASLPRNPFSRAQVAILKCRTRQILSLPQISPAHHLFNHNMGEHLISAGHPSSRKGYGSDPKLAPMTSKLLKPCLQARQHRGPLYFPARWSPPLPAIVHLVTQEVLWSHRHSWLFFASDNPAHTHPSAWSILSLLIMLLLDY